MWWIALYIYDNMYYNMFCEQNFLELVTYLKVLEQAYSLCKSGKDRIIVHGHECYVIWYFAW